jgi:monoamine oxidase
MLAALLLAAANAAVTNTTCDVLVLGAGLAGTSAAWRLVGERPAGAEQPRVCLIEASNRTGGRTKDHDIAGCERPQTVELGAQWIAQKEVDAEDSGHPPMAAASLPTGAASLGLHMCTYSSSQRPRRVEPLPERVIGIDRRRTHRPCCCLDGNVQAFAHLHHQLTRGFIVL